MIVTIEEAQVILADLIARASVGEEIIITQNQNPVAKLVVSPPCPPTSLAPRVPGLAKGKLIIVSDDDDHLQDFAEYM